jgi:Protein of unknown function (DUF4235)
MSKLMFTPISVTGGILAGIVSKKLFGAIWSALDDQETPDPEHRDVPLKKLIPALLLEGAIVRVVRGLVDHGARHAVARLTGNWPGEERPEPA